MKLAELAEFDESGASGGVDLSGTQRTILKGLGKRPAGIPNGQISKAMDTHATSFFCTKIDGM